MFFLQKVEDPKSWEQVDKYTWDNYTYAVQSNGQPRYTGNRVSCANGRINIIAEGIDTTVMCIISRFCGVRGNEAPQSIPGGFVKTQEYIPFIRGKRKWLHGQDGSNYAATRRIEEPSSFAQQVIGEQI